MKLHHINIKGPSELLKKEKEFFCGVLGLNEGFRPDLPSKGYWLYAEEKPIVHLSESDQHYKNSKQGFFDHVAFQSTNLTNLIERLKNNNIHYTLVYREETEMSQVFFKSPMGTRIEINFEKERI